MMVRLQTISVTPIRIIDQTGSSNTDCFGGNELLNEPTCSPFLGSEEFGDWQKEDGTDG